MLLCIANCIVHDRRGDDVAETGVDHANSRSVRSLKIRGVNNSGCDVVIFPVAGGINRTNGKHTAVKCNAGNADGVVHLRRDHTGDGSAMTRYGVGDVCGASVGDVPSSRRSSGEIWADTRVVVVCR